MSAAPPAAPAEADAAAERSAPGADARLAPRAAQAIKQRVLERVADTDASHLTIGPGQGSWQPFLDGIEIKVLHEQAGVLSYLLRLAPGARLPAHRHPADEECVVLEGTLRVGASLVIGAGGYHLAHQGALHAPVWTETGATIFLRGAVPESGHVLG